MLIKFLFYISLLSTRKYQGESYLEKNKLVYPLLDELIKSKCFSNIFINLDEPCDNPEFVKKCTFKTCVVPRGDIKQSNDICRTGVKKDNKCLFEDRNDQEEEGLGVNLTRAKQIYSGYKNNAADIWYGIYDIAKCNESLWRMISGIHYSITLHIAVYYKYSMFRYWSNPVFFYKKKNSEHYQNLVFAFKVVKYALSKLEGVQLACSLELPRGDLKKLMMLKKLIKSLNGKLPNSFVLLDYEEEMNEIKKLLNCIECDMCKLWGKIQFNGLETALDVISGNKSDITGNELIMLLNLYAKLSSSLIFNEKLNDQIKYRYPYFISLYLIEILTIVLSISIYFTINRSVKRKRLIIEQRKLTNMCNT